MKPYNYNLGLQFSNVAQANKERVAISYPFGASYTYDDLDKRSNQYSNWLIENGFKAHDVLAIFNEKSFEAFALMLGAIKIGVVYTNLDMNSPWDRLKKMIDKCQPRLVFYDKDHDSHALASEKRVLNDPKFSNRINTSSNIAPSGAMELVHGDSPAYIMFTSGSTGFPKGAVISHQNVLNLIEWSRTTFDTSVEEVFTNVNPIYFDNSVFDFYSSLFIGASIVPFTVEQTKNPSQLITMVVDNKCSVWFSVPSMLVYLLTTKVLENKKLTHLRKIIFGGEGFPKPKLKKLFDLLGDTATLYNVYGPTECTCICSSYVISKKDFDKMDELAPLGDMAPNFDYYIDRHDETGIGELCLLGPNVGWGYVDDVERTRNAFASREVIPGIVQRCYRTGDLVKKKDGLVHFMGRKDYQIKHMGYRIELEEIEAAIGTCEGVKEVAVVYKKISEGLGKIIAHVAGDLSKEKLIEYLKIKLPSYMMPSVIHVIADQLPKNQNGKIDRVNLTSL